MVVRAPAHVAVSGQRQFGLGWLGQRLAVKAGLQDRDDRSVARGPESDRAGAGRLQTILAVPAGHAHDPQAGAVALLRMRTRFELQAHHIAGARTD